MTRTRVVILALLTVSALFFFERFFLMPKSEEMRDQIGKTSAEVMKYEKYLEKAERLSNQTGPSADEMKKLEKRILVEPSVFLASVRMQQYLVDLAGKSGLNILNVKPMVAVKQGSLFSVPVYVESSGGIKQLSDFLKLAEGGSTMLKIDKISVSVTNIQNPNDLRIKLQLSGLARI